MNGLLFLFLLFVVCVWILESRVPRVRRTKYHSEYTHVDSRCPMYLPYAGSAGILGEADRAICFTLPAKIPLAASGD